jgi:hypothetical protein
MWWEWGGAGSWRGGGIGKARVFTLDIELWIFFCEVRCSFGGRKHRPIHVAERMVATSSVWPAAVHDLEIAAAERISGLVRERGRGKRLVV